MPDRTSRLPIAPTRAPLPRRPLPGTVLAISPIATLATAANAQLDMLQPPPDLPGLDEPPLLQHLLLENPIPVLIGATALALLGYAIASRARRRRLGVTIAGGTAALGLAGFVLATLIQTDREAVELRTKQTVAAVAEADTRTLDTIFDPEVRLYVRGLSVGWDSHRITGFIDRWLVPGSMYHVESHRVGEIQTQLGPGRNTARSRATVLVTPVGDRSPTSVICLMTWREDPARDGPEAWSLIEIQPLWARGVGEIDSRAMPSGF